MLVPQGRKELFESGILNYYNYGHLYDNSFKLVVRTLSQAVRVFENFLASFSGSTGLSMLIFLFLVCSIVPGSSRVLFWLRRVEEFLAV
ncbi:hypothetical protein V1506DRAFT_507441 [Lipomyces tetrasporus]